MLPQKRYGFIYAPDFSAFSSPAHALFSVMKKTKHKSRDPGDRLFEATSDDVSTLHRQSKKEIRLKKRKEWKEKYGN